MTFAPNPLFTLARSDGMILARLPDLDGSIGASIATGRLFREELARAPAGRFRSLSPIDGLDRFAGYATEAEFGVITIVGMGVDDALAGWRDRALLTAAKGLASFAILTLVILWDSRMRARVRKVETELIEAVSVSVQATAALQQAQHDRLTGLAGRALFEQQVPARIAEAAASGGALAYLLIDLDGFKAVNDRFGHAAGDEVLIKAAAVLTEAVRGGDLTARLGGDEFAVVATAPPETIEVTARRVAQRIVDGMAGIGQGIGCSVGIALVTDPQTTLAEGLDAADQAMYAAKRAGKGVYRIYEAA
jgi:diguanylate cyclase (GGDEF)-like protein